MTATESNPLLEKYKTLDQGERVQVMNVWIDGTGESMRCKTKTVESEPLTPEDLPVWNFDGSSTYQAEGFNSDLYLRPGTLFRDPFRLRKNKNVFSETYNFDHKPRVANHRPSCSLFMERKLLEVCITGADRLLVVVPNRDPRKLSLAMVSPDGKIGECAGCNKKSRLSVEVCVVLKLDNNVVGKTSWKAPGTECWKEQFRIKLDKSRELEVEVYWRDHRSLCGVAFLRLEELLDNQRRQIQVPLEPQGCLFAEVTFLNPTVPKKRRPRRQKRAFHFHKDAEKKFPRAGQKNTTFNVATRDRLQKTTALPDCTTNNSTLSPHSTSSPFPRDRAENFVEQAPLLDYGKVTEELESSHTDNLTRGQQELRYTSVREEKPIQNCEKENTPPNNRKKKKPMIQENRNKDDCSTAASRSSFSDSYNHSSIDQPRASFMRRNSKRKKSLCGPIDSLTEIEIPQINGIRYAQGPNGEVEDKVNQEEPIIINSPYSCKGFHQTMPKVERPLDEINESEDLRGKGNFVWIPSTSSENVCSKCGHLQENGNSPPTPTETRIHLMKGVTFLSKSWDILYSILRCIFLCLVLILGFLLYRIWCASCWSVRNVVHYAAQDRPFAVLRSRTSTLFEWIKRFTRSEKKDSRQGQTYDDADTTHKDVMLQNKDNDSDSVLGVPSDDSNDDNRKHKEEDKESAADYNCERNVHHLLITRRLFEIFTWCPTKNINTCLASVNAYFKAYLSTRLITPNFPASLSHRRSTTVFLETTISDKNKEDTSRCVADYPFPLFNVAKRTAFFQEPDSFYAINIVPAEGDSNMLWCHDLFDRDCRNLLI
ncbi:uncharacterized protein [Montipora capricornis]|uniref:uncharacterized protein isoform X2 n=1 Tax=Montipora capricornis TaxID=246305 RepID=UPI0035F16EBB